MNPKATVCVVGSINMDLTISTDEIPSQGETILGKEFRTYPGGKGANQAVAAARLGANVHMIGAVGKDAFGKELLANLSTEEVNTEGITSLSDNQTGVANIILSNNDNRIIVAPGANNSVTPEMVSEHKNFILSSDVVLLQLEIPLRTVVHTIKIAYENNVPVILNPAPYQELPMEVLEKVTYFTPNEIEADSLKKKSTPAIEKKFITTLGKQGVNFYQQEKNQTIPGYKVDVKDTTGAGDTFNGVFASEMGKGKTIKEAVAFANAAAALSVTTVGAQGGMPTFSEVEQFIRNQEMK